MKTRFWKIKALDRSIGMGQAASVLIHCGQIASRAFALLVLERDLYLELYFAYDRAEVRS